MIKDFLNRNKPLLLLLLFIPKILIYFLTSRIGVPRTDIVCGLDGLIPFVPLFIFPYILWYAYVPAILVISYFADKKGFCRRCAAFFGGAGICLIIMIIFPTKISFRPDVEANGIAEWICSMIFSADSPVNVLPSLHCYEALCAHLLLFSIPGPGKKAPWRAASAVFAVLACLSTVFVKQHSVLDLFTGCAIALIVALPVMMTSRRSSVNDNQTA